MSTTTKILWAVFISILLVLLPHTAWMFRQFEPVDSVRLFGEFDAADLLSYVAAFAFEAAIAVLIHKLSKHIEAMKRGKSRWEKFSYSYLNPFAAGLYFATAISMLANLAHAVQFGTSVAIFAQWGIPSWVYSVAFGGILPIVSLTFARVLSNISDDEDAPNPDLEAAKATIQDLRRKFAESEQHRKATEAELAAAEARTMDTERQLHDAEQRAQITEQAAKTAEDAAREISVALRDTEHALQMTEDRAKLAEDRFGALGDVVKYLFGEDKRQRILFARQTWAKLPNSAIAVIAESSPSYVSEVLNAEPIDVTNELAQQKVDK
jgi:hypothetical protein